MTYSFMGSGSERMSSLHAAWQDRDQPAIFSGRGPGTGNGVRVSMLFSSFLAACATLTGHVALWTWAYNRLHALGWPCRRVQRMEKITAFSTLITTGALAALLAAGRIGWPIWNGSWAVRLLSVWIVICWTMWAYVTVAWCVRRWDQRSTGRLIANHTTRLDALDQHTKLTGDRLTALLAAIPGNQILDVQAQHKILHVPALPADLTGLRIAQVTDLHMTGQLRREFFAAAVAQVNRWQPDLVALTGDIVDVAACVDWIPETLGHLVARHGVFFVLGNHDRRLLDVDHLRSTLVDCGHLDMGRQWLIREIRSTKILLAGNECPWFAPAPELPSDWKQEAEFSLLLSHSPDQLPWARRHGFDVMLAGHTHGGQIRFPLVGPVVCPSRFGVRYASGLFDRPPTLMHVSRGLSGLHPLRFRCPPEITLLELRPCD